MDIGKGVSNRKILITIWNNQNKLIDLKKTKKIMRTIKYYDEENESLDIAPYLNGVNFTIGDNLGAGAPPVSFTLPFEDLSDFIKDLQDIQKNYSES